MFNQDKKEIFTDLNRKILAVLFLYAESVNLEKIRDFIGEESITIQDIKEDITQLEKNIKVLGLNILKNENKNEEKIEYKLVIDNVFSRIAKNIKKEELDGNLTPSALQVFTICAYLGAASKNEISFIRGVQSTQSIRTLMARGLIKKIDNKYVLSIDALQNIGVKQVEDLPEYQKIKEDLKERLKEIMIDS